MHGVAKHVLCIWWKVFLCLFFRFNFLSCVHHPCSLFGFILLLPCPWPGAYVVRWIRMLPERSSFWSLRWCKKKEGLKREAKKYTRHLHGHKKMQTVSLTSLKNPDYGLMIDWAMLNRKEASGRQWLNMFSGSDSVEFLLGCVVIINASVFSIAILSSSSYLATDGQLIDNKFVVIDTLKLSFSLLEDLLLPTQSDAVSTFGRTVTDMASFNNFFSAYWTKFHRRAISYVAETPENFQDRSRMMMMIFWMAHPTSFFSSYHSFCFLFFAGTVHSHLLDSSLSKVVARCLDDIHRGSKVKTTLFLPVIVY